MKKTMALRPNLAKRRARKRRRRSPRIPMAGRISSKKLKTRDIKLRNLRVARLHLYLFHNLKKWASEASRAISAVIKRKYERLQKLRN